MCVILEILSSPVRVPRPIIARVHQETQQPSNPTDTHWSLLQVILRSSYTQLQSLPTTVLTGTQLKELKSMLKEICKRPYLYVAPAPLTIVRE